jgi:hypothetical protein
MATVVALPHALGRGVFVVAILPAHTGRLPCLRRRSHLGDRQHDANSHAEGERPSSVGFFFWLGRSSIVVGLGVALTLAGRSSR